MIQGTAMAMRGDAAEAEERLQSALRLIAGSPVFEAGCLAHLANLRLEQGDLGEATTLSERALEIAELHQLDGVLVAVSVYAIGALVAARNGRSGHGSEGVADHRRGSWRGCTICRPVPHCSAISCWLRPPSRSVTPPPRPIFAAEAHRARRREPGATHLNERLDALQEQLDTWPAGPASAIPRLTPAELRLLEYLPTHLTMQEVAELLGVTRNTAKSQNVAIYRKLGVASRSDAVAEARRLGIIH